MEFTHRWMTHFSALLLSHFHVSFPLTLPQVHGPVMAVPGAVQLSVPEPVGQCPSGGEGAGLGGQRSLEPGLRSAAAEQRTLAIGRMKEAGMEWGGVPRLFMV